MNEGFARIESVLLRCWICGFIVLIVWVGASLLLDDQILAVHGGLFGLNRHELDVVMYCGMGLWKLWVILVFFIPWLGLRMTRRPAQ